MDKDEGMSNLDRFDRYVMNDIPIRLIRLSDMKFVGRNDVKRHFQGSVPGTVHEFRQYQPSETVKYAILSHRWLDEGEPTYEEMPLRAVTSPGYKKLKNFCDKAREYNMEFAWSDTCCIDKSSSTELDESIRSMYRWYSNSDICIVHLAQSKTIEDMMDDGWMQRGWTLQELLAPNKVKFFNKHWHPMTSDGNDKIFKATRITKTLERATGIPWYSLSRFSPGPVKVDERMTWAAKRKTTRVEDVAYSLMGIFDVSLQIAYGEGGERAFGRLVEAIMQGGDPSVFNWTGYHAEHHSSRAIPRSPQNFVGRTILEMPSDPALPERLEMTMTSLGLRVPLVLFPLVVSSVSNVAFRQLEITLECPLCPTVKIHFVEPLGRSSWGQLALGIVNYSLGSCGEPRIRGKSVGFILERRKDLWLTLDKICEPSSADFIGLKTVPPPKHEFVRWERVHRTGLVEVNFPNILSDTLFYISREYLEIVYL